MKKINKYLSAGSTVAIIVIGVIFGYTVFFTNPIIPPPTENGVILPDTSEWRFEFYNNVSFYNESIWNRVIGNGSSPNDLYGPNSDIVNAVRKFWSKDIYKKNISIFDIVEFLFNITYDEVNKTTMTQSLDIGDEWPGWMITKDIWNFKVNLWELDDYYHMDYESIDFPILRYPHNYTDILEELQILVNNSYLAIDYLNATDLIYYMILTRIDFTIPTATYLNNTIQYLQPQNVSILGSNLTLTMQEQEIYYIHAYYHNESGYLENLSYYDSGSRLFYQQKGWGEPYPPFQGGEMIFGANIPITICISIITFIGIILIINKKLEFKTR